MNQRAAFGLYLLALLTYSQDIKPILDARCVECHSAGSDLDLAQFPFSSTTALDQSSIVENILGKVGATPAKMPPGNRPKLTASQVSAIQEWRDQGLTP